MNKYFLKVLFLIPVIIISFLICPANSFAKTDLSIADTDITFSKENLVDGQVVRIYARVFNNGDTDVYGNVMFYGNGKELSQPQPISVRANNYDDVFFDWTAVAGTYDIQVKIVNTNPIDENLSNNVVDKKNVFVDADTNKNSVGDSKENLNSQATNDQNTTSADSANAGNLNNLQNSAKNIVNSIEGVLGIKSSNTGWIMTLQKYLDTASQNVKGDANYDKYLLIGLLIVFVILILFFKRRKY